MAVIDISFDVDFDREPTFASDRAVRPSGETIEEITLSDVVIDRSIGRMAMEFENTQVHSGAIDAESVRPPELRRSVFGDPLRMSVFGIMQASGMDTHP